MENSASSVSKPVHTVVAEANVVLRFLCKCYFAVNFRSHYTVAVKLKGLWSKLWMVKNKQKNTHTCQNTFENSKILQANKQHY